MPVQTTAPFSQAVGIRSCNYELGQISPLSCAYLHGIAHALGPGRRANLGRALRFQSERLCVLLLVQSADLDQQVVELVRK